MGVLKRNPRLLGLGVLLAVLAVSGGHARADVTSDQAGSIVLFPKVISDGTRDTLISITNTSNLPRHAHCVYVNASGVCSVTSTQRCNLDTDCPSATGEVCVHQCVEHNFDIDLTPQQPTEWLVSIGRNVDATDPFNGLDPGNIPGQNLLFNLAGEFSGELKCIETDSDAPIPGNSFKGEATIVTLTTGQVSVYNGVSILAGGVPDHPASGSPVFDLNLNRVPGAAGAYNACPVSLIMNHRADFSGDSFTGLPVLTELTLVPCSEDFENLHAFDHICINGPTPGASCTVDADCGGGHCSVAGTHSRALFSLINEFESPLSANITFDCWLNRRLSDISSQFSRGTIGSDFVKTRISPPTGVCSAPAAGAPCVNDAQCGGGTCTGTFRICYSGTNKDSTCSTDADCPNFLAVQHQTNFCVGGDTPGAGCAVDSDCPGVGATCLIVPPTSLGCRPWTGLLGVAEEFQLGTTEIAHEAVNLHLEGNRPGDVIVIPIGVP